MEIRWSCDSCQRRTFLRSVASSIFGAHPLIPTNSAILRNSCRDLHSATVGVDMTPWSSVAVTRRLLGRRLVRSSEARFLGSSAVARRKDDGPGLYITEKLEDFPLPSTSRVMSAPPRTRGLWVKYQRAQELCRSKKLPADVDPRSVFTTNELDLGKINVYGFDYDYTLARYKPSLNELIYELARGVLVSDYKYPPEILELQYDDDFAIRGLHFDTSQGILMKVDQFQQIQASSVYRGLSALSKPEVEEIYGASLTIPAYMLRGGIAGGSSTTVKPWKMPHMVQLADAFAKSQICLLSQIKQFMMAHEMSFHSRMVFDDVNRAVQSVHPKMHHVVGEETAKYVDPSPSLREFLLWLKKSGKQTFIVTNSPFHFIRRGLNFLVGKDWQDLFDVVVCAAAKPFFFLSSTKPFRRFDPESKCVSWEQVTKFRRGQVYLEGNCVGLEALAGWKGSDVLYFGDHPYSDLADLSLNNRWNTAAIVDELSAELTILNQTCFKERLNWMLVLNQLIDETQDECFSVGSEGIDVLGQWKDEERALRLDAKQAFNKQFGSVFRTDTNPTYFSRRLFSRDDVMVFKDGYCVVLPPHGGGSGSTIVVKFHRPGASDGGQLNPPPVTSSSNPVRLAPQLRTSNGSALQLERQIMNQLLNAIVNRVMSEQHLLPSIPPSLVMRDSGSRALSGLASNGPHNADAPTRHLSPAGGQVVETDRSNTATAGAAALSVGVAGGPSDPYGFEIDLDRIQTPPPLDDPRRRDRTEESTRGIERWHQRYNEDRNARQSEGVGGPMRSGYGSGETNSSRRPDTSSSIISADARQIGENGGRRAYDRPVGNASNDGRRQNGGLRPVETGSVGEITGGNNVPQVPSRAGPSVDENSQSNVGSPSSSRESRRAWMPLPVGPDLRWDMEIYEPFRSNPNFSTRRQTPPSPEPSVEVQSEVRNDRAEQVTPHQSPLHGHGGEVAGESQQTMQQQGVAAGDGEQSHIEQQEQNGNPEGQQTRLEGLEELLNLVIEQNLCAVCMEPAYDAVTSTSCLHTFCGYCLWRSIFDGPVERQRHACPKCRAVMNLIMPAREWLLVYPTVLRLRPEFERSAEERERLDELNGFHGLDRLELSTYQPPRAMNARHGVFGVSAFMNAGLGRNDNQRDAATSLVAGRRQLYSQPGESRRYRRRRRRGRLSY